MYFGYMIIYGNACMYRLEEYTLIPYRIHVSCKKVVKLGTQFLTRIGSISWINISTAHTNSSCFGAYEMLAVQIRNLLQSFGFRIFSNWSSYRQKKEMMYLISGFRSILYYGDTLCINVRLNIHARITNFNVIDNNYT